MKFKRDQQMVFADGNHVENVKIVADYGMVGNLGHLVRVASECEFVVEASKLRPPTEEELRHGRPISPAELHDMKVRQELDRQILKGLLDLKGSARVGKLADHLGWSPVKVSAVSRRMESEGSVVRRFEEPTDKGRPYMVLEIPPQPEPE